MLGHCWKLRLWTRAGKAPPLSEKLCASNMPCLRPPSKLMWVLVSSMLEKWDWIQGGSWFWQLSSFVDDGGSGHDDYPPETTTNPVVFLHLAFLRRMHMNKHEGCQRWGCQRGIWLIRSLDGRNHVIVIAESLARVIVTIRITSVHWRSYLPPNTEISPHRPCFLSAAVRIARLAFIRVTFVPCGIAELLARVDCVRWTLAIGDWRYGPAMIRRDSLSW